jgi:hypothetical protein
MPATPAVTRINNERPDLTTEVLFVGISPSPPGFDSTPKPARVRLHVLFVGIERALYT